MSSFHQGPLKNIHDALSAALPSGARTDLPDTLGTNSPCGRIAREVLSVQGTPERIALGALCSEKLRNRSFIQRMENREAIKVVLQEVSIFASQTAQELGLSFATALNRSDDAWLRIIAGLEVAELLSRLHVYAPASTAAYKQLFDCFDSFMRLKCYEKGAKNSLFHPIATAHGDPALARTHALEAVLQYGEEALRLFWGLQARAERDGQTCHALTLRAAELQLTGKLSGWSIEASQSELLKHHSWFRNLQAAIDSSRQGTGPASVLPKETPRSIAVRKLLQDVRSLTDSGDYERANRHATSIRQALENPRDQTDAAMQDSFLVTGYIKALLTFRISTRTTRESCDYDSASIGKTRELWAKSERLFHEPGTLWSRAVTELRTAVINEVPLAWRVAPPQLPI